MSDVVGPAFAFFDISMDKTNAEKTPELVLDCVLDAPTRFGDVVIGDITILKYAYLEKLKSPFLDPSQEFTVENIAPAVFVLASDKATLRKYGSDIESLKFDALDWMDENVAIEDVPAIIKAVVAKLVSINKAAPNGSGQEDDGKKK
ncbi:hypothetical protein [Fibrobacter sp.]|uniref:hypothetical protein n=1 Tax=Fibrobacter sp. TaxID=35828 RepID=UPI00388F7F47